jgi:DNA-directed RNA polymerase specialized sigma24 family protein
MSGKTAQHDAFPATMNTWIGQRIDSGDVGRADLNRHIMAVYAHPLKVYFLGSSFRRLGEPDEMVEGFFASRLPRPDFFREWRASTMRLRRWLMNAFLFFLQEQARLARREAARPIVELDLSPAASGDSPEAMVDRAWAMTIVQQAWKEAEASCAAAGQERHWRIFILHHAEGRPYADLQREFGVSASQAAVMTRTASNKFKAALRDCIVNDGVAPSQVDAEIELLLETFSS